MKEIWFVINPISGIGRKGKIPRLIDRYLDKSKFNPTIIYTEYRNHGREIANKAVENSIDILAIVGGDGSINEVSGPLINSSTKLAIIPNGSGNGIARHFKIPRLSRKAISLINDQNTIKIDTGLTNYLPFIGFMGVGFDAFIAYQFDKSKSRGFLTYAYLVLKTIRKFKPFAIKIEENGLNENINNLFFCVVTNTSQFGNNFKISPGSVATDGLFELVFIQKKSLLQFSYLILLSFFGDIRKSKMFEIRTVNQLSIINENKYIQIDGDPVVPNQNELKISCVPNSLELIVSINRYNKLSRKI